MSDQDYDFTAQAIDIAFASTKQRLIDTIEAIDLVPPKLLDEIISGAIAIGSMTGAFMLSSGIVPDEDEQNQFTRSFPSINQELLDLQDRAANTPSAECFFGFTTPTSSNNSIGWVITIVRSDGHVVMTSDPLAMEIQDARRHVIEKLHGAVDVQWIERLDQITIPAVREVWHRVIESRSN